MSEQFASLEQCEKHGEIELGRGQIISQVDINDVPGDYPIYSSSSVGDGVFGRYGKYMFEEELITWSIDGGGRPFHRRKHRYSVTNVCGFLRINDPNQWDYKYVYALLEKQHSELKFDYQLKAHPSVIKKIYKLRKIPLLEQGAIAHILDTIDEAIATTTAHMDKLKLAKAGLLHDLLTRGIDDNGELRDPTRHPEQFKDSELGLIPKDWDAVSLSSVAGLQVGYAFKSEWFAEDKGINLMRGENVGYGNPDWSDIKRLPLEIAHQFKEYELFEGNIIIGMDRTFTKSGCKISILGINDVPSLLVQRVGRFTNKNCNYEFLRVLLNSESYRLSLQMQEKGMDIPHLSQSDILSPLVPIPGKQEQIRIAQNVLMYEEKINTQVNRCQKLKLLKQSLMSDLLTGRVRVQVDVAEAD